MIPTLSNGASIPVPQYESFRGTAIPSWWRGEPQQFESLARTRLQIHLHEKAVARKTVSVLAIALFVAVSAYSVDAASAVGTSSPPGFLLISLVVVMPAMIAWVLDRRLVQQLSDINLRSTLWIDLVNAVKHDRVDLAQLHSPAVGESEIESLLRREIDIAARFLASRRTLAPRLPLFGHCFTLKSI